MDVQINQQKWDLDVIVAKGVILGRQDMIDFFKS